MAKDIRKSREKPGQFRYIDWDKLVPYLEQEIKRWMDAGDECESVFDAATAYARATQAQTILSIIKSGVMCYQQGSE